MGKRLLLLVLLLPVTLTLKAQSDFDLTQRWFNEVLYNPAAAGNSFSTGIFLHGRQQWTGIEKAPATYALSFDTYASGLQSGFGLTVAADKIGVTSSYNIRLTYAYYIKLGDESALSLGLSVGVINRSMRISEAEIDNPSDPELAYGDISEYSPDFDLGLEYKGPLKFGVSVRHLGARPSTSINLPAHTLNVWAYASSRFNLTESLSLEPLASLTVREDVYRVEGGFLLYLFKTKAKDTYNDRIWLGGVYRSSGNIAVMAGIHITPGLRLGYSFDYGLGDVSSIAKSGTHELFLAYQLNRIFYKEPACPAYRNAIIR